MGRIKSTMIKKAARELFEINDRFNEKFEKDKSMLKGTMPSKKVRNKVAGGLVRLAKQKQQRERERKEGKTQKLEPQNLMEEK